LLGEDMDNEKFKLEYAWGSKCPQPFENMQISQFGLELSDSR